VAQPYYKSHWIEIEPERHLAYDDLLKFHPAMERLLEPLELRPGLKVLDVGSGPGHTTIALAQRVLPGGHVSGVDINAEFVERAGNRARSAGLQDAIDYRHSEFPPLPFADRTFDRVWCKNVLEYVDDAGATVAEMARVTAPDGIVVAVDSDWGMMAVELGEQPRALTKRIVDAAQSIALNQPQIGRRLFHHFLAAGLQQVEVKVFASPDRKGLMAGMLRNSIARYAVDSGKVSAAEVQQWLAELDRAQAEGRYLFLLPQFVVSGRRSRLAASISG
jgi:ubiquinone/menaquinone biosynthesis C-methylase UbiE